MKWAVARHDENCTVKCTGFSTAVLCWLFRLLRLCRLFRHLIRNEKVIRPGDHMPDLASALLA